MDTMHGMLMHGQAVLLLPHCSAALLLFICKAMP
jgi:hypothetical protein